MASDDTVLVINHHQANLTVKDTGKSRIQAKASGPVITTTVQSEPITFMLDEGLVAKRAAQMFAQRIREQTEQIVEIVKPATAKARAAVEKAYAAGKPWALRRFSGGRTGATPPVSSERRMFNHSGRLAKSIVANYSEKSKEWFIRYAANRWYLPDFKSAGAMAAAFQKWVDRVAVLQDPSADLGIQRAIRETFADIVHKNGMDTDHRTAVKTGQLFVEAFKTAVEVVTA